MPPKRRASKLRSTTRAKRTKTEKHGVEDPAADFDISKFMATETIDPATFQQSDLDNPIHDIFSQSRFQRVADYAAMETSLRLASKLLETHAVQALLYTIVAHRDPLVALPTEDAHGRHLGYSERDCPSRFHDPTGVKRRRIDEALRGLATLITFVADADTDGGDAQPTTIPKVPHPAFPAYQRRSKIRYGQSMYLELQRAHHGIPRRDEILLMALQFQFGVMLAHEVVHTLVNAAEGRLKTEPFLFDAVISETGFEAEKRWFGGHLELIFKVVEETRKGGRSVTKPLRLHEYPGPRGLSDLAGVFVLMDYPYKGIIKYYRLWRYPMGVRNEDRLPQRDAGWRVSMAWISQFFQKAFWRRVDDDADPLDMLAPKAVRQYFRTTKRAIYIDSATAKNTTKGI